jgi:hypothetical protein
VEIPQSLDRDLATTFEEVFSQICITFAPASITCPLFAKAIQIWLAELQFPTSTEQGYNIVTQAHIFHPTQAICQFSCTIALLVLRL